MVLLLVKQLVDLLLEEGEREKNHFLPSLVFLDNNNPILSMLTTTAS
jgi:hypothetical protein